ncbi:MAG: cytidylate kinase family protein [Granulosicoccus sp.]
MPVIAMTREMGSKGKDIAIGLSDKLNIPLVHHNLVEQGVSAGLDVVESDVHRHLEGRTSLLDRWKILGKKLSNLTACEVLQLAEKGNVIIRGWGSTYLLRSVDHVMRVRVCAPLHCRVQTMMQRLDTSDEKKARQEIQTNDLAHERILKRLVRADWQDPLLYDLVINTERVPVDEGIALIEHTLQLPSFRETSASRTHLMRLRIESQLKAALSTDASLKRDAAVINYKVDQDTLNVTLSGGVRHHATRERMKAAAICIPDVKEVVNEIQLVHE